LLCLLDLVCSFGMTRHPYEYTSGSPAEQYSNSTGWTSKFRPDDNLCLLIFFGRLIFQSSQNAGAVRMTIGLGTREKLNR
jgi:hypothetical protein